MILIKKKLGEMISSPKTKRGHTKIKVGLSIDCDERETNHSDKTIPNITFTINNQFTSYFIN